MGDSKRVPYCTPRSRRPAAAGAPTQAAVEWQAEAPTHTVPPSVLAPSALRGQLCVHLPAGMASFDAIAPTQRLSPSCWAGVAARSASQPRSPWGPRRGGARSRGAPRLRRGYLDWIAPGAAAAAAGAAGPPPSRPLQGRSANSQPWRGASTLGPDAAETLLAGSTDQGRGPVRNSFQPSLSRPLQLLPAWGLAALKGKDSGQGHSANSPPSREERSTNSERPSLSGAVCKLSTLSERTSKRSIPQPKGRKKRWRQFDSGHE